MNNPDKINNNNKANNIQILPTPQFLLSLFFFFFFLSFLTAMFRWVALMSYTSRLIFLIQMYKFNEHVFCY